MEHEHASLEQNDQYVWVDLPFLIAPDRTPGLKAVRETHSVPLATVRVLVSESSGYPRQLIVEVNSAHMHPRLHQGDWLRCQGISSEAWRAMPPGIYVLQTQGQFLIRRLRENDLGRLQVLRLYADNPHFGEETAIPEGQLTRIWRVIEIVSGAIG